MLMIYMVTLRDFFIMREEEFRTFAYSNWTEGKDVFQKNGSHSKEYSMFLDLASVLTVYQMMLT